MRRPDLALAESLFANLAECTADPPGVTRASYGEGEQMAHDAVRDAAHELGLESETDAAGNLYMTWPGRDRQGQRVIVGSHLDSVPHGGNYDGAAGVLAGLTAVAELQQAGVVPARDITIMAIRAEESTWFPVSYIGSRAALGTLPEVALEAVRADTGRSLADHMCNLGFSPEQVRAGQVFLRPAAVAAFIELHIEQGPRLIGEGCPLGLVTGIRGSFRYRQAKCIGEYGHSGAVPRTYRRDAVVAVSALVSALDELWADLEARGEDLTITVGQISTNPAEHAFSKIAGEVGFCLDVRSISEETLTEVRQQTQKLCNRIADEHGVRFDLGAMTGSAPARMNPDLIAACAASAQEQSIPTIRMGSGAGHDAAAFVQAGIPACMFFIRNAHGSHNPQESMSMDDFAAGASALAGVLRRIAVG